MNNSPVPPRDIYRSATDVQIAGVCAGIAQYFNISTSLVRLVTVLALFIGIPTPLLYLVCWAMMPQQQ